MTGVLAWLHAQLQAVMAAASAVASNQAVPARTVLAAQADVLVALLAVYGITKITKKFSK